MGDGSDIAHDVRVESRFFEDEGDSRLQVDGVDFSLDE